MMRVLKRVTLVGAVCLLAVPAFAQNNEAQSKTEQPVPAWVRRGIPGGGHTALEPLVGTWRAELSIYVSMGRSPDLPPIVSRDIRTGSGLRMDSTLKTRPKALSRDSRTGGEAGSDYSNIDRRYEWVTIGPRVR